MAIITWEEYLNYLKEHNFPLNASIVLEYRGCNQILTILTIHTICHCDLCYISGIDIPFPTIKMSFEKGKSNVKEHIRSLQRIGFCIVTHNTFAEQRSWTDSWTLVKNTVVEDHGAEC